MPIRLLADVQPPSENQMCEKSLTLSLFCLRNAQGDIIHLIDSTGNTVVSYAYDAWGNPMSGTGSLAHSLGQANPCRG